MITTGACVYQLRTKVQSATHFFFHTISLAVLSALEAITLSSKFRSEDACEFAFSLHLSIRSR